MTAQTNPHGKMLQRHRLSRFDAMPCHCCADWGGKHKRRRAREKAAWRREVTER